MDINSTVVKHHEFEGFSFVEFQGEFYKGCKRCGGTGHYSFNGFDSICYACGNTSAKLGDHLGTIEAAQKWCHGKAVRRAQADRKREQERLAKVAKLDAKVEALRTEAADVVEFLLAVDLNDFIYDESGYPLEENKAFEKDSFIRTMAEQLQFVVNADRPFTANMVAAVRRTIAKRQARQAEAAANPAPSGRVVVTGEIVGTKVVEGDYGTAYKVTVKDDQGFRVYVSLPKAQADEAIRAFEDQPEWAPYTFGYSVWFEGSQDGKYTGVKGRRITFTATLEQSRDDASFAFGSRPTKGAWL